MIRALTLSLIAAAVSAAPAYTQAPGGARGDFLANYADQARKFEALAGAFPTDKYAWAPGKGVRSVCATFSHIAAENYDMGKAFGGGDAPAGLQNVATETCIGDKAVVVAALKKSFDDILAAVRTMPDADLSGDYTLFGAARPRRRWLLSTAEHTGEHLGQLIAYARMNNIVPPWSK